jgi:hypothetical protein
VLLGVVVILRHCGDDEGKSIVADDIDAAGMQRAHDVLSG